MSDYSIRDVQLLDKAGAAQLQTPVVDQSFGRAAGGAFDLAVESDWSISGYIADSAIRSRDTTLGELVRNAEVPLEVITQYRDPETFEVDFDGLAGALNEEAGFERFLTEDSWRRFRQKQFQTEQRLYGREMASGGVATTGGMVAGSLLAGASDPGMLAVGLLTAGAAPLAGGLVGAARGARTVAQTASTVDKLGEMVEAAQTVQTLTRWQRAMQLARPAALEGAFAEATLMAVNAENRRQLGADYTPAEILANIGFGAGLGGAVGGAAGALGVNSFNAPLLARQQLAKDMVDQLIADGGAVGRMLDDMVSGRRDLKGRLVKSDLPEKALSVPPGANVSPYIGDVRKWGLGGEAEDAYIRLLRERLPEATPAGMRTAEPPKSRADAKQTLPLGTFIDGGYRGLSGRSLVRLLDGDGRWNRDTFDADKPAFSIFSSAERAGKMNSGGFIVRFNPDAMVGRMVYRKSDIGKQWAKGDVTFRVMNDSKYQPEGRTDNFLADAIEEIRVSDDIAFKRGSDDMKKLRKRLRQAGFKAERTADGFTVFRKKTGPKEPTRAELAQARDGIETAVRKLMDSKEILDMMPEGTEGLPFDYVMDRINGAARKLTLKDVKPLTGGRAVDDFNKALGLKRGEEPTVDGVLSPEKQAQIDTDFARLMDLNPDFESVNIVDGAMVDDTARPVRVKTVVDRQQHQYDKLHTALNTCTAGGAA